VVFEDANYGGWSMDNSGGHFEDSSGQCGWKDTGWWDSNEVSSLRGAPGKSIQLCDNDGLGAPCKNYTGNVPDLKTSGFNDKTNSFWWC